MSWQTRGLTSKPNRRGLCRLLWTWAQDSVIKFSLPLRVFSYLPTRGTASCMGNMRIILRLQAGTARRTPIECAPLKKRQIEPGREALVSTLSPDPFGDRARIDKKNKQRDTGPIQGDKGEAIDRHTTANSFPDGFWTTQNTIFCFLFFAAVFFASLARRLCCVRRVKQPMSMIGYPKKRENRIGPKHKMLGKKSQRKRSRLERGKVKRSFWNEKTKILERPPTTYGGVKWSKLTWLLVAQKRRGLHRKKHKSNELKPESTCLGPHGGPQSGPREATIELPAHQSIQSDPNRWDSSRLEAYSFLFSFFLFFLFFFFLSGQLTSHTNSLHRAALHERGIVGENVCCCRRVTDELRRSKNGWFEHGSFPSFSKPASAGDWV